MSGKRRRGNGGQQIKNLQEIRQGIVSTMVLQNIDTIGTQRSMCSSDRALFKESNPGIFDVYVGNLMFFYDGLDKVSAMGERAACNVLNGLENNFDPTNASEEMRRLDLESRLSFAGVASIGHDENSLGQEQVTVQTKGTKSIAIHRNFRPGQYVRMAVPDKKDIDSAIFARNDTGDARGRIPPVVKPYDTDEAGGEFIHYIEAAANNNRQFQELYGGNNGVLQKSARAIIDGNLLSFLLILKKLVTEPNVEYLLTDTPAAVQTFDQVLASALASPADMTTLFRRLAVGLGLARSDYEQGPVNFSADTETQFQNLKMTLTSAMFWRSDSNTAFVNSSPTDLYGILDNAESIEQEIVAKSYNNAANQINHLTRYIYNHQRLVLGPVYNFGASGDKGTVCL